jgi:hypothetical protein
VDGSVELATVPNMSSFEQIMSGERGLSRRLEHLSGSWDALSTDAVNAATLCLHRRLVTRVDVAFTPARASALFECGTAAIECIDIDPDVAVTIAQLASKPTVDLRVTDLAPAQSGWTLTVCAQCDSPMPFRSVQITMGTLHADTHGGTDSTP